MASDSILLTAEELFCERDDRVLFENLNFSVKAGEILRVEGPNGAGKTTLLKIVCGLMPLRDGELFWKQQRLADVEQDFHRNLLFLGHKTGIKGDLTPLENLKHWSNARLYCTDRELMDALAKVGLEGYEYSACHSLSAGQQRRAALARLHLAGVPLWILDEAFTAIDKQGVAELEQWISAHALEGGAVILTTHHVFQSEAPVKRIVLGQ